MDVLTVKPADLLRVKIRCLTSGAHVMGQRMREGQELEVAVAQGDYAHLVIREAAGDISITAEKKHADALNAFKQSIDKAQADAQTKRAEEAAAGQAEADAVKAKANVL